jgi:hypothetical protein
MTGAEVLVCHRLGAATLAIATRGGAVLAEYRRLPDGAGAVQRAPHHVTALETAVLKTFSDARPCKHKTRRPPSTASLAEAARLRGIGEDDPAARVVIDLADYAAVAARLGRPTPSTTDIDNTDPEEMA